MSWLESVVRMMTHHTEPFQWWACCPPAGGWTAFSGQAHQGLFQIQRDIWPKITSFCTVNDLAILAQNSGQLWILLASCGSWSIPCWAYNAALLILLPILQIASIQYKAWFWIISISGISHPMRDHQVPAAKIPPFVPWHLAKMILA